MNVIFYQVFFSSVLENLATGKLYPVTVNMFVHVENRLVLNQFSFRVFSSPESLVLKEVVPKHYRH